MPPPVRPEDMSDTEYFQEGGTHDAEFEHFMEKVICTHCGDHLTMPCERAECVKAKRDEARERRLVPEGGMSGRYPEDTR